MPVQFLSGGGGTSDVRSTFAAPVLTDCSFTNTIPNLNPVKWTIPANYFQVNDSVNCTLILDMLSGNTASKNARVNFRIGTTGTISDASIAQVDIQMSTSVNLPESTTILKGLLNIKTTGTSGTCVGNLSGVGAYAGGLGTTPISTQQTINTSSVLYLTMWVNYVTGSTGIATFSPVGSSICVSF